jgi:hypothetical protein
MSERYALEGDNARVVILSEKEAQLLDLLKDKIDGMPLTDIAKHMGNYSYTLVKKLERKQLIKVIKDKKYSSKIVAPLRTNTTYVLTRVR